MKRSLVLQWINKALEQEYRTKLFIPAASKEVAKNLKTTFTREIAVFDSINPESSSTLISAVVRKDSHWWLVLQKVRDHAMAGFVKKPDGSIERVQIEADDNKRRRLEVMRMEGLSLEEVEVIEGKLSKEETIWYLSEQDE